MGLLYEIQTSVVQDGTHLGSVLLKLRLLASRLGSVPLEEWIKHESEGYLLKLRYHPIVLSRFPIAAHSSVHSVLELRMLRFPATW
jgi:hypothetical protein